VYANPLFAVPAWQGTAFQSFAIGKNGLGITPSAGNAGKMRFYYSTFDGIV
jgi:hypothetical protein